MGWGESRSKGYRTLSVHAETVLITAKLVSNVFFFCGAPADGNSSATVRLLLPVNSNSV